MTIRTMQQTPVSKMPSLWPKLPDQNRRQLAAQLAPALRRKLRSQGEGDANAENPVR
jgi:hypothetical protein